MKASSVATLFVLALQTAGISAVPNEDGAVARQKAALEAFDAAHKDYLKTGDLASSDRSLTNPRENSPHVSTNLTGRTIRQARD